MYPPLCEITVSLRESELWKKIHSLGNEIPVKPVGRLIFPLLNFNVSGFDPEGVYTMGIKLRRVNTKVLEFKKNKIPNKWRETGQSVEHFPLESNEIFETSKRGEYWMNWGIKFEKIKIHTNGRYNQSAKYVFGKEEMMLVNTRCKYVPILTIYKIENEKKQLLKQFVFEETQFITVESRSVLLDVTTPPFHQNLSSSQKDHHLSGAFQIFQVPAARYADGLEQYLPKDPVARMEFEQADLDDIIMCTLLDSTL
ncbi:hypothetical protein GCK72_012533 [Caenorhabditis remanei]|uniref:T-box domain-containing protein n=1 Tax=Caenorhabditis remanei TaxID=31234 RepID=A0A6A5GLA7_CAERE|nr:hypothetical protein GCK72_012533 [Caenorhabditis remanei]KAF1756080.1 hypothetical protein GCK72_012533 [Caenorhabditis remanei]